MRRSSGMGRLARLGVLIVLIAAAPAACGPPGPLVVDQSGTPGVPGPRSDASSAYDAANGTIVMFGGVDRTGNLDETWAWDGAGWRRKHPAHSPSPRELALMAFDPTLNRVLLYGGLACPPPGPNDIIGCDYVASATELSDSWSWDGHDWSRVPTAHSPDVPYFGPYTAGMATDQTNRQVILVSFTRSPTAASVLTTWTFRGGDWLQLHTRHQPPDKLFGGPAFDGASKRLLLEQSSGPHVDCGTVSPCAPSLRYNTTWAWDGSDWRDLGPGLGTPHDYGLLAGAGSRGLLMIGDGWSLRWDGKRWSATADPWGDGLRTGWTAALDAHAGEVIVFGGRYWGTNQLYGDTDGWDGGSWRTLVEAAPSPSAPLGPCVPSLANAGPGWEVAADPTAVMFEQSFVEPKAGPCHLDVVVHFSLTGAGGRLLPIPGNPAQIELVADLTFEAGTWFATFTLTNACGLPPGAMFTLVTGDLKFSLPATTRYCPDAPGPMAITPGTLHRPQAK